MKRKSLSKKTRFEVFKRDSFTCQYCGRSAPEVVLQVDHIKPVAKGGTNDIMNLVTSCFDCNQGKKDRELSDNSVISKQQAQIAMINEKREQLEMMVEWRDSLKELDADQIQMFNKQFDDCTGFHASDVGKRSIRKWLKTYSLVQLLEALDRSFSQYATYGEDGNITYESVQKIFDKVPGIAYSIKHPQPEYMKRLYYIRGIMRNRFSYYDGESAIIMLRDAYQSGVDIEDMMELAKESRNWTEFRQGLSELVSEAGDDVGDI